MDALTRMPGDANYLEDVQTQYDWQLALTRAMAEYWREPEGKFAQTLLNGSQAEIAMLFKDVLSYELPQGLTLNFEAVDVKFDDEITVNGWAAALKKLSAKVIIPLPNPPSKEYQAKAIADYVATGKAYPFT